MENKNNSKDKNILIHSLQGSTDGSITLQELIDARQGNNKKDKGDDES